VGVPVAGAVVGVVVSFGASAAAGSSPGFLLRFQFRFLGLQGLLLLRQLVGERTRLCVGGLAISVGLGLSRLLIGQLLSSAPAHRQLLVDRLFLGLLRRRVGDFLLLRRGRSFRTRIAAASR